MEIRQFRVVLKARDFDRTSQFYGEVLALPRLQSWDREDGRGALFQAGTGAIEVQGRRKEERAPGYDEDYDFQGPQHKLVIALVVPSAEKVYEELIFRDRNIPGGLREDRDGSLVFETHDPDGVKVVFRQLH
jgi:catechol 2,3-dioxygenase-like lactoylglutathione lyase family enzyme